MLHRRALLLAGMLGLCDCRSSSSSRDVAWKQLQVALDNRDDLGTIRACEAYLVTFHAHDPDPDAVRTELVRQTYQQAFVRWMVSLRGKPDSEAMKHIERFEAVMSRPNSLGDKP
jgi:hypothetical protein